MKSSKPPYVWLLIALGALAVLGVTVFAVKKYGPVTNFNEYVALAGVLVNLVGFLLVFQQLRAASQAAENQTRWEIEQVSFNVYNLLVHKPKLRPYFYDGLSPPPAGEERWEVDAACELFLDYFETIVGSSSAHDDPSEEVWRTYMRADL